MKEMTICAYMMYFVMFTMLGYSAYTDVKQRKIKNYATFPVMLIGLILNYFETGIDGVWASMIGMLVMVILFLLPYYLKQIGAGDIKLLMAIAAIMGTYYTAGAIMTGSLLGAFYAAYLWLKTKDKQLEIPYGLFLFLGTAIYQSMLFAMYL